MIRSNVDAPEDGTERRWPDKRWGLYEALQIDPARGLDGWFTAFADALLAWQIDVCEQLVAEPFLSLLKGIDLGAHFQQGIQGIRDEDYPRALTMLVVLAQASSFRESKPLLEASSRAVLLIFLGRIHLYQPADSEAAAHPLEQALQCFEQARELTPDDGRPSAALGEYYRLHGAKEEALRACQQAITQAPDHPDGHLVLGLLFEDDRLWDEADAQYVKAINASGRRDGAAVSRALDKLLAPVSGNVYLQLARMIRQEAPEQAHDAALQAICIGMKRVARLQIKHRENYVERVGFRLLDEIFDTLQEPAKAIAARAYYESGRRCIQQREYQIAVDLLKRASERDPDHAPTYWYWAAALSMLAANLQTAVPAELVKRLQEVLNVWDKGYAISSLSPDFTWAYLTRALAVVALAELQPEQGTNCWWEAAANLEQGLLLEQSNTLMWAALAHAHRSLNNYAVALQAVERARQLNGDDLEVLGERALILAILGHDSGREAIDRLREKSSDASKPAVSKAYADQLEGILLFQQQKYAQAIPWLDAAVGREPTNIGLRCLRGQARRRTGDHTGALEDFRWVWEVTSPTGELADPGSFDRGCVAYELGDYTGAVEIFQGLLGRRSTDPFEVRSQLARCYLALDQLPEVETWFNNALPYLRYRVQVQAALRDLAELEQQAGQPERRETIARYRQRLSAAGDDLPEIEDPKAATLDLRHILEAAQPEPDRFVWLAAAAGLARIASEAGRWEEATAGYSRIMETETAHPPPRFREARVGLLAVARVYAQFGFQAAAQGDLPGTQAHFRRSIALRQAAEGSTAVSDLLSEVSDLITSTEQAETLKAALETLTDTSATLNGFGKGLISQWLRDSVDLGTLPEGNKIFGVADDVIEADTSLLVREGRWQSFAPGLTVSLPQGWLAKESMTLLAPNGQANVIASSEPLDPSIDTQRYAESQGELLRKEFAGYRELHFGPTPVFGGRQGYVRRFEWTPLDTDVGPITQMQLYYAEHGRGYTATATTPSSQIQPFELLLRQILGALRIER